MTLKFQLDKLDGLDAAVSALYKKSGDGYVLDVEGAVPQAEADELRGKLMEANEESRRRRKAVEKWEKLGKTPEEVQERIESAGKGDADHEKIVNDLKSQHDAERAEDRKTLDRVVRDSAVKDLKVALAEANVVPEGLDILGSFGSQRIKVETDGKIRIMSTEGETPMAGSGKDGYATVADLAKELAAATPHLVKADAAGGGGKAPASGSGKQPEKTITRAEFDQLSPTQQRETALSGVTVVDAAAG